MGKGLKIIIQKLNHLKWYLRKVFIIWLYVIDFKNHYDLKLTGTLIKYIFTRRSNKRDLIVNTHFGKYLLRRGTMDFKMANKAYERKVIRKFKTLCSDIDLVLDIGANTGIYSLIAINSGAKEVLAFEPVVDNYNALLRNIELNNYKKQIKAFRYGIGDQTKTVDFYYNHFNTGSASIHRINYKSELRNVRIKKFDELFLDEIKSANNILIKMDVEGMETEVINGMKSLIASEKELSLIIEIKHTDKESLQKLLTTYASFEFSKIDSFNMLAIKNN